ncbi:hypothetical protein NDU88_002362 [Pleurodeles waltl]|uniref:Uncharacterized protein n=1 Tax=Pleurodeles waltl TaxID=8319 RepID=A0AAV7T251_PLEWA|nr:hypothetical protein NDU88_002362 [Pleurodeles waltl]
MLRARRAEPAGSTQSHRLVSPHAALAQRKPVGQIPPGDRASLSTVMTRLGRRTTASARFSPHFGSRENSRSRERETKVTWPKKQTKLGTESMIISDEKKP